MKPLTPPQLVAELEARIARDGWHKTADALGQWVSTLQRVCWGQHGVSIAVSDALGYRRMYRNGSPRSPLLSPEDLREHARQFVRQVGSYRSAADALGVDKDALFRFATKPAIDRAHGETAVTKALGFSVVYVPK